ncbi:MAG TPA: YceI family protein, partial [Acidimicrobiales bacterium]|nr:YceI family protein [Acidimicrobiales bacterium]
HSEVGFSVRHLGISKTRGRFGAFTGTLKIDAENPSNSSVEVEIDAASIDTKDAGRDEHLRSADFFDVEQFPTLTFRSTAVRGEGSDWVVEGDLTIRGVTRPVVLETELVGLQRDPWGNDRVGFAATTEVNREEFGLTWNAALETGGVLVGKTVKIHLDVEAIKASEEA